MGNKKVLSQIDLGKYKKPNAYKNDIIYDPMGQWKYPGENTRIPGGEITMQGVNYPVWAQPNVGQPQMMYPGVEYNFPGADYVDEFPQMQEGGYIEADLTDDEIEQYRKGGFIVEDISVPKLIKAQNGKNFKRGLHDADNLSNTGWSTAPTQKQKTLTPAQKKQQEVLKKDFKVNDKSKYEKVEDKIKVQQKILEDAAAKHNFPVTEQAKNDVANMEWSLAGVGPQKDYGSIQNSKPKQSNSSRVWDYITNPLTAFEYSVSGGGAENMPHNINAMRMAGIDAGVVAGRNLVGNALNAGTNLFDAGDKVIRNIGEGNYGTAALEGLRFLPGARVSTGLGKKSSIQKGLLANPYKLNSKALNIENKRIKLDNDFAPGPKYIKASETNRPLPEYMEPYISRSIRPATKHEQILESYLLPETQLKAYKDRITHFDKKGNIKKQKGGVIETELTPKQIAWYKSQGYTVEELD